MTLSIFMASGDSISNLKTKGQDELFINDYLKTFSKYFKKIYLFSYKNEKISGLPKNVELVGNKHNLHRYIYGLVLPFIHKNVIKRSDVIRTYHLYGTVPAIITKVVYRKPFVFNMAYDYERFALLDGKFITYLLLIIFKSLSFFSASGIFVANRQLLRSSPKEKSTYLPNGVNVQTFSPVKHITKNRQLIVLSVGRLERQKNFSLLINALQGVRCTLTIVGSGSQKEYLTDEARKKKVKLTLIEKKRHDKMPNLYNSADIFVLPSHVEGHPKVLLEAMSCALPVIGTNVSGTKDIIKNGVNGLLVQNSSASLKEAIISLINSAKLRKRIANGARESILKNYDLTELLTKEVSFIKSVMHHETV